MKRLSIIVPVFNVEKYLSKCLDSLLDQDIPKSEYEIIIINDGSTDCSAVICESYKNMNENVILISQENMGLGVARNTGIRQSKGKYIQFVDSDDYLEKNVLKQLVDKMDSDNLDILRFNYQNVNEQYIIFQPNKTIKPFVDYSDSITAGHKFLTEKLGYACYAWQFIIQAELLKPQNNYFKKEIYFEDTEWTPRILLQVERVCSTKAIVYNYLMRQGSIMQSVDDTKKHKLLHDQLFLIYALLEQQNKLSDKRWYQGMISTIVITLLSSVSLNFYSERGIYLSVLNKKRIIPLSFYHCTFRNKIRIIVINFSPSFYCWLINRRYK
jgi:glycosyltransferase involved in cell wall biosynthesis